MKCGDYWVGREVEVILKRSRETRRIFHSHKGYCFKRNCDVPGCMEARYKVAFARVSPVIDEICLPRSLYTQKGLISHYVFTLDRPLTPMACASVKRQFELFITDACKVKKKGRGSKRKVVRDSLVKGKACFVCEPKPSKRFPGKIHLHWHMACSYAIPKEQMAAAWKRWYHAGGYVYATYSANPWFLKDYFALRLSGTEWEKDSTGVRKKPQNLILGAYNDEILIAMKRTRWFSTRGIKLRKKVSYLEIMLEQFFCEAVEIVRVDYMGRIPVDHLAEKPPDREHFMTRLVEMEF